MLIGLFDAPKVVCVVTVGMQPIYMGNSSFLARTAYEASVAAGDKPYYLKTVSNPEVVKPAKGVSPSDFEIRLAMEHVPSLINALYKKLLKKEKIEPKEYENAYNLHPEYFIINQNINQRQPHGKEESSNPKK